MPIYEYACTACDHRTDILHGLNDPGPQFCPSCGREGTMRKLFAPPTIHYRGTGWAKKDRGGSSGTKPASSAKGAESSTGERKGSGTDAPSTSDKGSGSSGGSSAGGSTSGSSGTSGD